MNSQTPVGWSHVRKQVLARDGARCVECGTQCSRADADVHHLLPRSAGGADDPSNLITLCDGCHAAHHPKLAGTLARRMIESWAVRLAHWLGRCNALGDSSTHFGSALRLFGLNRFRDGQLPVVQAALSGRSILVISPTGFGKTLCFQLPAVLRPGLSVVVSPLKALMSEQVSALFRKKIPATFINSDLDLNEKRIRYRLLRSNSVKFLYAAPERFFVKSEAELEVLRSIRPAFMVIDEAHCVDQWGQDFRPEYGKLREVRKALGNPPVLAFTATAGMEMQTRILKSLGIEDAQVFVRDVDRPNISLIRWKASHKERPDIIARLCRIELPAGGKVMIFVPTRKIGEDLQRQLDQWGLQIPFYHSNFGESWDREQLVKRFSGQSKPEIDRVICTSAFGMGLDISNVRMVIHWQHPASTEDYVQECGRAGRDGKPSVAVLLHFDVQQTEDKALLHFMADKTVKNSKQATHSAREAILQHKRLQIEKLAHLVQQPDCFRQALANHFSGSEAKAKGNLSQRLLEWVFADRSTTIEQVPCCDTCCQKEIDRCGKHEYVRGLLIGRK